VLGSSTHLVEIDLLRAWEPMPLLANSSQSDYRILVSRGDCRPSADLYAFNLQDTIPLFPLPLQANDLEPIIDLKMLLSEIYDRTAYDLKIDYTLAPVPPLSATNAAWANALLTEKRLR
jgi:hypothetical protein